MKKFFLILFTVFFAGCGGRYSLPSGYNAADFDIFIPVNIQKQENKALCGLAAIEMVAGYYGKKPDKRFSSLLVKEAEMSKAITAASLKACLEASGFDTAVFKGSLSKEKTSLYSHLNKKRPLIILASNRKNRPGHFIIINGYKKDKCFTFIDPIFGPYVKEINEFLPLWKNGDFLTLLALPKK